MFATDSNTSLFHCTTEVIQHLPEEQLHSSKNIMNVLKRLRCWSQSYLGPSTFQIAPKCAILVLGSH